MPAWFLSRVASADGWAYRCAGENFILESISNAPASRLLRISEVFADFTGEIISGLGGKSSKKLGSEYFLIRTGDPQAMRESDAAKFVRWNLPVHHSWPCNPEEMEGFVEKAAQALFRKFGALQPQAVMAIAAAAIMSVVMTVFFMR